MVTKLSASPVSRELDVEIAGRKVVVTLEVTDNVPMLRFRPKGYRTGWEISLEVLSKVASWHRRLKSKDMTIMATANEAFENYLKLYDWKSKFGGDLM